MRGKFGINTTIPERGAFITQPRLQLRRFSFLSRTKSRANPAVACCQGK